MKKLLVLLTVIVSVGFGVVVGPIEAKQGRIKRDESTPGYPLNYFTGSDDYSSGDIEISHELYRPTADLSVASSRQNNHDRMMSTTIDNHQSAFDVSSSSEYDSFYSSNHEELIGIDGRTDKIVLDKRIRIADDELTSSSAPSSSISKHETHKKSYAQNSKLIKDDRDVIKPINSKSDQVNPCDDSFNERILNNLKLGNSEIVIVESETSDITIDVTHDVFETTTSNQGGLLMGIIYQGKLSNVEILMNGTRADSE